MPNIAVILSGCGVYDGSEIHESVLTLLAIENAKATYQCFAPDIPQHHVINHLNGEVDQQDTRNVLVESARIARGQIKSVSDANAEDFDALILPGGFGAAKNLSNFAFQGAKSSVEPSVLAFGQAMIKAKKPVGFICIAPAMIPHFLDTSITLTIGNDIETAQTIESMGAKHQECTVDDIVVDEIHKIVSTPAYMLAQSVSEASQGIHKLVNKIAQMC